MNQVRKFFKTDDIGKLFEAFKLAFSDYFVNFSPSATQFQNRIFHKLNVMPDISGLIWEDKEVIGFILHTFNEYQGKKTVYNGGTGVIPGRRNRKLTTSLYQMLLPAIAAKGTERVLLEVVCQNQPAIRFYESLGFVYTRTFRCFKNYETYTPRQLFRIENSPEFKIEYESFWDFRPAFLDHTNQLQFNMPEEFILEAYIRDKLVGYVIFQPLLGRISQLAVHKAYRGQQIARELLAHVRIKSANEKLTIMNIPDDEEETINSLMRLGFKNEIDQYEMELIL